MKKSSLFARRAVVGALAGAALVAAGCGDDEADGGLDPASILPASAPVYFELTIDPEGDLRSDAWRTVDLFLRQELTDTTTFDLSLNNITDATYTPHLETQPSPGFNAQASLIVRF